MMPQIIFAVLAAGVAVFSFRKYSALYRNIMLGKDEPATGSVLERAKNTLLVAFGQKKMFARPIPAILHMFIYLAFMVTQLELVEILVDGFTGGHRTFGPFLGGFYNFVISFIEVLSLLALVATVIFLWRRNGLKLPRFQSSELKGWPFKDANIILITEIVLVTCIFMMNGAEAVMKADPEAISRFHIHYTEQFAMSGIIGPALFGGIESYDTLHLIERIGWWGHILAVFAMICYLPFSKHLHIFLAFPGTFFARLNTRGEMANMPEVQKEVASMLDPEQAFAAQPEGEMVMPKFGVTDVFDLSWQQVLSAYSCTECGRCTSVCPANLTGKLLSPRKVVMNVRDRADEIGANLDANKTEFIKSELKEKENSLTKHNYDDGRSLFDYISNEELRACTTCNACVEACPVLINPLDMILGMRRNLILEQSQSPESWNVMFNNMENNGAPWAFSSDDRDKWTRE